MNITAKKIALGALLSTGIAATAAVAPASAQNQPGGDRQSVMRCLAAQDGVDIDRANLEQCLATQAGANFAGADRARPQDDRDLCDINPANIREQIERAAMALREHVADGDIRPDAARARIEGMVRALMMHHQQCAIDRDRSEQRQIDVDPRQLAMARQLMETFDTDGDGLVTQAEIDAVKAGQLDEFDTDGDGTLNLEEFQAFWVSRVFEQIVDNFQHLDANGDGFVTLEEFSGELGNLVERLDRDDDGGLGRGDIGGPGGPGPR